MAAAKPQSSDLTDFASAFRRVVSSQGCDEIVRWAGAIMPEQRRINSGLGLARCAGMRAFSYIAALSLVGAILVASTSFTDRRSVKTWAPNTVVLKPKPRYRRRSRRKTSRRKLRQPFPTRFAIGDTRHGQHARRRRARALSRRPAQRPPCPRGSQSSSGSPKEETEGRSD